MEPQGTSTFLHAALPDWESPLWHSQDGEVQLYTTSTPTIHWDGCRGISKRTLSWPKEPQPQGDFISLPYLFPAQILLAESGSPSLCGTR